MNTAKHITRFSRLGRYIWLCINAVLAAATMPLVAVSAPSAGDYTREQAQIGAQIYSGSCSVCHGSRLQGGAAPALTGPAFAQSLKATYSTASALFALISTQMPVNNPGSLSKQQYTQVLAFILAKNGYPAGSAPLDVAHLDEVALLPYPNQDAKTAPDANLEIANIGSANRLSMDGIIPISVFLRSRISTPAMCRRSRRSRWCKPALPAVSRRRRSWSTASCMRPRRWSTIK
jgi:mono/diheme cytochrome c family protein